MKKLKTCLAFFICCILSLNMVICNVKADNNVVLSNKAYLLKTGMPQKEIEKLDYVDSALGLANVSINDDYVLTDKISPR